MKHKDGLEIYFVNVTKMKLGGKPKSRTELRWRIRMKGRIIAASTEGYTRFAGLVNNLMSCNNRLSSENIKAAINKYKSK